METKLYKFKHSMTSQDTYLIYYRVDKDMPWEIFQLPDPSNFTQAMLQFDNLTILRTNCIGLGTTPIEQKEHNHES